MTEQQTNETTEPNVAPEDTADEPKTFDADYVAKLRQEAAEARTKAKEASERGDSLSELLLTRSIEQATAGILIDPTDLPRAGDYFTDAGSPDLAKIKAAAEQLATAKPYLSRPRGSVSQGARESSPAPASLGDMIRAVI
jgi:hypothetical protein